MTLVLPGRKTMQAAFVPFARAVASNYGSLANIYQLAEVLQPDKSTALEPNNLPATDIPIKLTELTGELAQEAFGRNTNVTLQGTMPRVVPVSFDDIFEITDGPFAEQNFQVKALIDLDLSDTYLIGFVDYEGDL